ncbi:MAG: ParB/RepB/Spo0J family partition protein [Spongiibacteraceae bacterium]|jgi:ParB family chromosome partitioning protein
MSNDVGEVGKSYLKHNLFNGVVTSFKSISTDLCDRGYFQTRTQFDTDGELQELADSLIQTGGNFTPIVVRQKLTGRYEIISGERRVRAAMIAGIPRMMALIGDFSDDQAAIICITENLQRADLNPIEEAEGLQRMLEQPEIMQKDVAILIGKSRPYISNMLRLLKLDRVAKDLLEVGKIDIGHGKALSALKSTAQQREWAQKCARNGWSVRYLENALRKLGELPQGEGDNPLNTDRDVAKLELSLSDAIGQPCRILFNKDTGDGQLVIKFFGAGNFEGVLDRLEPGILDEGSFLNSDTEI